MPQNGCTETTNDEDIELEVADEADSKYKNKKLKLEYLSKYGGLADPFKDFDMSICERVECEQGVIMFAYMNRWLEYFKLDSGYLILDDDSVCLKVEGQSDLEFKYTDRRKSEWPL